MSEALLQAFHSASCLLIASPAIIHLPQEFVLRSRTNTLANPLSWQSDTEVDICTCIHIHPFTLSPYVFFFLILKTNLFLF